MLDLVCGHTVTVARKPELGDGFGVTLGRRWSSIRGWTIPSARSGEFLSMHKIAIALLAAVTTVGFNSAYAADVYAPLLEEAYVPPAEAFSWSGLYFGGIVGYGWGDKDAFETESPEDGVIYAVHGFFGGIEAGGNWQFNHLVLGIEGDVAWADINGAGLIDNDDPISTQINFLATLTGRLGIAWDRLLLYVEGGGAWAKEQHTFTDGSSDTVSDQRFGGLIGVGAEYALARNWSVKLEYNYICFGSKTFEFDVGEIEEIQIDQNLQTIKLGLNYRF